MENWLKIGFYAGLRLRWLRQNQMSTPDFLYESDQRYEINIVGEIELGKNFHSSTHKKIRSIPNPGIQPN